MASVQDTSGTEYAKAYAKYRPKYPEQVRSIILEYAKKESFNCDVVLDVACASGQATFMLSDDFNQVYGIDKNQVHLDQIKRNEPNVKFFLGGAEKLDFPDCSVDLITIAQGLRYIDVNRFYSEAKRVLHPGGVLAAFGHNFKDINLDKVDANFALYEFDRDVFRKNECWAPRSRFEEKNYKDFDFPLRDFQRIFKYEKITQWSVSDIVGLIETTTAAQIYKERYPNSNEYSRLCQRLKEIYREDQPVVTLPIVVLLGRK